MHTFISLWSVNNITVITEIDNHKKICILHCDCVDQVQNLGYVLGSREKCQLNGSDFLLRQFQ